MNVVTRFPPSPTGYLHIGRARTALFNYLFAKKNGGKMIFRFEDTDKARSKKEFETIMIESLQWLGITWDNEVIEHQTARTELYKKYLHQLVAEDKAYISKEKILEGDKAGQENEVVRFRNPNKKVTFTDLIRGDITFDTEELKDFIIARNIDDPLYHLAVVVDDFEMGITHIIRGDDGISNTPRQILIQEGIGAPKPIYAHLPLILAPDKSKLSGRHGAVSVTDYRTAGYLPEALINYLALLGWNPGTDRELYSLPELISLFDLSKVQKSGAVFNIEKLQWFNRQYILKLSDADFASHAASFIPEWLSTTSDIFKKTLPLLREKICAFSELSELFADNGEMSFTRAVRPHEPSLLLWKKNPDPMMAQTHLGEILRLLQPIEASAFTTDAIRAAIWPHAEKHGKGDVLWPLRVSLTGQEKSPDPVAVMNILGKAESLKRIEVGLNSLATLITSSSS